MEDIPKLLSASILDTYEVLSIKIDYADDEYDPSFNSPPDNIHSVMRYLNDKDVKIIYSACGIHINGKHKKPHCHYHLIVEGFPSGEFRSNNSQNRKRWLAKEGNEGFSFDGISIQFSKKENPVWQVLSYPYKEGIIVPGKKYNNIPKKEYKDFLVEYGKNLYQVSLGKRARQDACDERKKNNLTDLYEFCEKGRTQFSNLKELRIYADEYIAQLELSERPNPSNFKNNCMIVASKLGIFNYSDF